MKDFFKSVFATVVGIFLTLFIMVILAVLNIAWMVATSAFNKPSIDDNSVLVLNLEGSIVEQGKEDIFGGLLGGATSTTGLDDIIGAIDKAKNNDKIKGIYIEAGVMEADYASLQEIRQHLEAFKQSKKWIVSYADEYMQGAYYVASVADKVYMNPKGGLDWHGIASQPEYYRDLMAKFGVKMNVVKVGTYKSFTETYTEDHMSDANREQVTAYINGIWDNVTKAVSKSRNISVANLNAYADSLCLFTEADVLKQRKMVDGLLYADQVKAEVKKRLELDEDEAVSQVSVAEMRNIDNDDDGEEIAVYYCEGSIVMSPEAGLASGGDGIVAKNVCKDLEDLMNNDDVKAVVIRLNSGGGDAYASEQLWHTISMLKAKKPVVVSMGGAAASGGYYMSCNASYIFAQPTTLTGSIGIFGAFPDFSELLTQKLGMHFDEVKTNANASFSPVGLARHLTVEEQAILQSYINRGYELFVKRVADGRKKSVAEIKKIAEGRVWLGQDAIKIGLVDELGGLDAAVAKAAALAKVKEYHTTGYPAEADFFTQLMQKDSKGSYLDEQMRLMLGAYYEPVMMVRTLQQQSPVQARLPWVLNVR